MPASTYDDVVRDTYTADDASPQQAAIIRSKWKSKWQQDVVVRDDERRYIGDDFEDLPEEKQRQEGPGRNAAAGKDGEAPRAADALDAEAPKTPVPSRRPPSADADPDDPALSAAERERLRRAAARKKKELEAKRKEEEAIRKRLADISRRKAAQRTRQNKLQEELDRLKSSNVKRTPRPVDPSRKHMGLKRRPTGNDLVLPPVSINVSYGKGPRRARSRSRPRKS